MQNKFYQPIQISNRFILSANDNGILLIHQRRAHKRILFEYFNKVLSNQKAQSQQLLFPQKIELNNIELELITNIKNELNKVGFIFEIKAPNLVINAIPPECQEDNLQAVIESLIEQAKNSEELQTKKQEHIAKSLAKSLAIHSIKKLSDKEIQSLNDALLKCNAPSVCPSGKPTMINLKTNELNKYF